MDDISASCVSCQVLMHDQNHTECLPGLVKPLRIPLCDHCLEFPHRMDISRCFGNAYNLQLPQGVERCVIEALVHNKTNRYQNPTPVIIGLILLELNNEGGVLLAGRRAPEMKEYPNQLALLSGYMETKHGGWRGALRAEGEEELCVEIDTLSELVFPVSFETAGKGRLLLNWAVGMPGATKLNTFIPNKETSERHEIPFTWGNLPQFGIPQHNSILKDFCSGVRGNT